MKILSILVIIIVSALNLFAQKTVAELAPKHSAALEEFLAKHKAYGFLSEKVIDAEDLKFMRSFLGAKLKPFYCTGDFNQDKIPDFAMILSRKGEPKQIGADAEGYELAYPLVVVIFNGAKNGTFKPVFTEEIEAPLVCFLNFQDKRLYFAVSESDADTRIFTPAGKGYIIEYPDEL